MTAQVVPFFFERNTQARTIMSEREIVENSIQWRKISAVYFLVKNRNVVYVGQSMDVIARIKLHEKTKDFDSVTYLECPPCDLDELEYLYIYTLDPPLNGLNRGGKKIAPLPISFFDRLSSLF